jgi:hypothetical protein
MRILGVTSSAVDFSTYELIETAIVSGSTTSNITFSGLEAYSSNYKHLQIRGIVRSSATNIAIRINGDTGTNYTGHQMYSFGTTVPSDRLSDTTLFVSSFSVSSTETANAFAASIIDILDAYAVKNKTLRTFTGMKQVDGYVGLRSGLHINTSPLASISLTPTTGTYVAGSRFSIYGIRG